MSKDTAQNFMSVATKFGKNGIIPNLRPTVLYQLAARFKSKTVLNLTPKILYALAAPSTPDEIVEKSTEKAESG